MRTGATLDHVTITASDFGRSAAFYDAALGALGLTRLTELVDEEEDDAPIEAAAWGDPGSAHGLIWLVSGASPTQAVHIRLMANSKSEVEALHRDSVQAGGRPHLAPRRWTPYRRGEYQTIVCDPDGNLIEACCAE